MISSNRYLSGPFVTVELEQTGAKYTINKEALTRKSEWFKNALSSDFGGKEAKTGTVIMQDENDTDDVFDAFFSWIYLGRYTGDPASTSGEWCVLHAKIYVLAERLMLQELKDLALNKLQKDLLASIIETGSLIEMVDLLYTYMPPRTSAIQPLTEEKSNKGEEVEESGEFRFHMELQDFPD